MLHNHQYMLLIYCVSICKLFCINKVVKVLHNKHLQQIVACIQQQQLVHALLLQGALITTLRTFADAVAMALVCYHPSQSPCFNCQACILSKNNQHPDVRYISTATSATKSGIITIDIVREIIECAYLSPQL